MARHALARGLLGDRALALGGARGLLDGAARGAASFAAGHGVAQCKWLAEAARDEYESCVRDDDLTARAVDHGGDRGEQGVAVRRRERRVRGVRREQIEVLAGGVALGPGELGDVRW